LPRYRNALPQLSGDIYLANAGAETDLIFNHGVKIFEFATHTLLSNQAGRRALTRYFEAFLDLANASTLASSSAPHLEGPTPLDFRRVRRSDAIACRRASDLVTRYVLGGGTAFPENGTRSCLHPP
jgi:hypothetical protein